MSSPASRRITKAIGKVIAEQQKAVDVLASIAVDKKMPLITRLALVERTIQMRAKTGVYDAHKNDSDFWINRAWEKVKLV